jgi:hypothetical protein
MSEGARDSDIQALEARHTHSDDSVIPEPESIEAIAVALWW